MGGRGGEEGDGERGGEEATGDFISSIALLQRINVLLNCKIQNFPKYNIENLESYKIVCRGTQNLSG